MPGRGWRPAAPAGAALLGLILVLAAAAGGAPRKPAGDLAVTVVSEGTPGWSECRLSFRHGEAVVKEGEPTHLFKNVPAGTYTLIADALAGGGDSGGEIRLLAAAKAQVRANQGNAVTVTLLPAEGTDSFCSGCHPTRDEAAGDGQLVRDVHSSGIVLPTDYAEKVTAYNRETEELRNRGETERLPMPVEEREGAGEGKATEKVLTCESCHTFHLETPYASYVRASYRKGGDLCTGCHP